MVEQQLDDNVGPQVPFEGSSLQHTAQRGHAVVVNGIDISPMLQEETRQAGVGSPTSLVQGAPPCLIPGIHIGTVGSQESAELQASLSTRRLPAEDVERCLLLRAERIHVCPVAQVEPGMVAEAVPGCHMQSCLTPVLTWQVDSGSVSQEELGTSAKR